MVVPNSIMPRVFYLRRSDPRSKRRASRPRGRPASLPGKPRFRLVREYVDDGISGDDTEHRVAFRRMVWDAAELKDFDVILCWDQDRFGRFDPLEAGYWIKPLRDQGVRLETVTEGKIGWDDFAGRIISTSSRRQARLPRRPVRQRGPADRRRHPPLPEGPRAHARRPGRGGGEAQRGRRHPWRPSWKRPGGRPTCERPLRSADRGGDEEHLAPCTSPPGRRAEGFNRQAVREFVDRIECDFVTWNRGEGGRASGSCGARSRRPGFT